MARYAPFIFIFFVVFLNALAQLLMKAAALAVARSPLHMLNWWLVSALACLGFSFVCWQFALRLRPLSFLHPFCSLTYVLTPACSALFFQEGVSVKYILGILCIITGICITSANVGTVKQEPGRFKGSAC
jgi:drug/metabolite transporter (DMT)-like permease